ncbi:unnamed protein product [Rotaria sordida]|uniref:Alcohol dehydrogenase n=1 Tax=Rotaria sordida TaxID=392033 RepID=A0A814JDW0_9BILA|nr:unnamed protein product [Rotaria sordida]
MQAAVVTAFEKPLEIKQVEIPKPGPTDVLLKMIACGVCHTDLHVARGQWDVKPELPRIPGHEGIGEVVEIGSMVGNHLKKGDIVGIPWLHASCLHCEYCLTGRETLCKQQINSGYSVNGCFSEYALMDGHFAVKLPEDLHVARGQWDVKPELPRIPGHEGIGEIVEIGSMVGNHLKKGDIIGIPWLHASCLHCEYCLTGRETLCKQQINSGYSVNGCFSEYALMDGHFAVKLPEGMDPYTSAPLYCAGVTVYKALKVSQVRPGEWVSIVGVGGLGSVAVKYAVAMGMRVVAVVAPNDKTAVQLSKDMGAEEVYDGPSDQHGKWIQEKVGGVQGSVVTVPIVAAFEQAFQSVKRGGRVVAVALPNGKMTIPIVDCVLGGIEIVGSIVGTRKDLQECLEIAKLHKIECRVQKRKLQDINDIFEDMINYRISGRVVLDFTAK